MTRSDYWLEAIREAAEEAGVTLTDDQAKAMAEFIEGAADNIGQAFYIPSSSDRISEIERSHKRKVQELEDANRRLLETTTSATKRALKLREDYPLELSRDGQWVRAPFR